MDIIIVIVTIASFLGHSMRSMNPENTTGRHVLH